MLKLIVRFNGSGVEWGLLVEALAPASVATVLLFRIILLATLVPPVWVYLITFFKKLVPPSGSCRHRSNSLATPTFIMPPPHALTSHRRKFVCLSWRKACPRYPLLRATQK